MYLLAVLNGVQFEVKSENISKSSEGQIKFDYLLTSNGIAKASGNVSGFVDSLYLEGSIQTDTSVELASMGMEEYEPVLQACEFSFKAHGTIPNLLVEYQEEILATQCAQH